MSRNLRNVPRIDYQILHSTGKRVIKPNQTSIRTTNRTVNMSVEIINSTKIAIQEVTDVIEENPTSTLTDIDESIQQLMGLRLLLRENENAIHAENPEHELLVSTKASLQSIRDYVRKIKDSRAKLRQIVDTKIQQQNDGKKDALLFSIKDTTRTVNDLIKEFEQNTSNLTDEELIQIKSSLASRDNQIDRIAKKYQSILLEKPVSTPETLLEIKTLGERYELLITTKSNFVEHLTSSLGDRDVYKQKLFSAAKLNIEISKFSGYDDVIDIYTFKDNFSKVHEKSTPKHLLGDLLKNNYLQEPALGVVKMLTDIDEIWSRLKSTYGDVMILLNQKLNRLANLDPLYRMKDPESTANALNKMVNLLKELSTTAETHKIEQFLYYGGGINKIYSLIGDARLSRWLTQISNETLSPKAEWKRLIIFLESEMKIQQQKMLIKKQTNEPPKQPPKQPRSHYTDTEVSDPTSSPPDQSKCFICDSSDHILTSGPQGTKLIQYFVCKKFVEMTPSNRFAELKRKNLCYQCLFPGAQATTGKHREGKCQKVFTCQHPSHEKYTMKKHILVCNDHKSDPGNQEVLEQFKSRCIVKRPNIPEFSKTISNYYTFQSFPIRPQNDDSASGIYQLQQIIINSKSYLIFYDSGCSDFVVRDHAIDQLESRARLQEKGPIKLGGVGDVSTLSSKGIYSIDLPTFDGSNVTLTGVALKKITSTFPNYPLDCQVKDDIHDAFRRSGGNPSTLPKLPSSVGGDVDFMIGIRYLRYHPKVIFQMPSGLTIYKSLFKNPDGSRGIIGGPHEIFSMIEQQFKGSGKNTFFSNQLTIYKSGFSVNPDVPLLCAKPNKNQFDEAETAGSIINYRCMKCRDCENCKTNDSITAISIREEIEQDIINKSIEVIPNEKITVATLPFTQDPNIRLHPNRMKAKKVYDQQVKKLSSYPNDKRDVIESEAKLQKLGHVDFIRNLHPNVQNQLAHSPIQNFIPWRAVWKASSVTTPCRVVFDASQPTNSGYSLNSILAKGTNGMNKLVEILIRWYCHKVAFHTDVTKMYNAIKLDQSQWCYQRYLWNNDLHPNQPPEEKVIKTLIYGVKSSGNQAERAIRQTSALSKNEFPEIDHIVNFDLYVDDCITGEDNLKTAMERADQMEISLGRGGFGLKGFTFNGSDPPEALSKDGKSIGVGGMIWYPKDDEVSIDVSELNFAKKRRGKKPDEKVGIVPSTLTRRHCVSKVHELFDITGKITPITASLKIDLHNIVQRGLKWDDAIPDNLRAIWESNFEMIQEIKSIRYARTIVPNDAANLMIETIDFGDATKEMAAVAIYARILRLNGEYSCQLVFARSKILSSSTQPRAELEAAVLNTHTSEVVKRALKSKHNGSIKLTDSTIVLHWISNDEISLKPFVRNRIIEIIRHTTREDWQHIDTNNMLADIATRKGATIDDISSKSTWINGHSWLRGDKSTFPTKTVSQINFNSTDLCEIKNEAIQGSREVYLASMKIVSEVRDHYSCSKYLIDPNKFRFQKVIRILAQAIKFLQLLRSLVALRKQSSAPTYEFKSNGRLTDDQLKQAETYFWRKGTEEVKQFVSKEKYKRISTEIDGILTYTGRIMPTDEINVITPMTKVMKDLHQTTFCVPIISKHSPIAYAVLSDVHWHNKVVKHSGIEATLRYASQKAFIIEGREVAKKVKASCKLCRFLEKSKVKVSMGKTPSCCRTIAPAFYNTQCDLAGPFQAYSSHNKRKTIKIWLSLYCCISTSTLSIKVMDDYSTPSFLMSFTRFACDNGYPKTMYVDRGSQIIKGFQDTKISFNDLQHRLHVDVLVDFELCPVGGHNYNGKVERKIREVKSSIEKSFSGHRLSVIQWETICSEVANSINDLPLALNGIVSNFDTMDLITPNRLKLGRNNDRSPAGPLEVTKSFSKILDSNTAIYNAWFDQWLINHVPKLMHQPKWFVQDRDIAVDDIVLFAKNDSAISSTYQYGIVKETHHGNDNKIRKVTVLYKNANEKSFRETTRAVRELIVIHQTDEHDLVDDLNSVYSATK
ncbi:uncharacterized protein [Clytia hemisphaerica]|uniref:uncharacterized protein n=1 Tax=Clytia hemisphaerica TaxID=252671 RepID=UPI0034D63506